MFSYSLVKYLGVISLDDWEFPFDLCYWVLGYLLGHTFILEAMPNFLHGGWLLAILGGPEGIRDQIPSPTCKTCAWPPQAILEIFLKPLCDFFFHSFSLHSQHLLPTVPETEQMLMILLGWTNGSKSGLPASCSFPAAPRTVHSCASISNMAHGHFLPRSRIFRT